MRRRLIFWAAVAIAVVIPLLYDNQFQLYLLQKIAYLTIAALGLNIVVGYAGQISIGHAGFYAIGAYTSVLLATKLGVPFWISAPAAIVVTIAVSIVIAAPTLRTRGVYLAMVTLAFGFVVFFLVNNWTDLTGGPSGIYGVQRPPLFGHRMGDREYYVFVAAIFVAAQLIYENVIRGRMGRTLLAINSSELGAAALGISAPRWKMIAIAISAAFTGIAGILFAHQEEYLNSDSFTFETSILFLVALLLGGVRTRYGPLLGSIILVVYPSLISAFSNYQYFILGILLVGTLLFLPNGILAPVDTAPTVTESPNAGAYVPRATQQRTIEAVDISKDFGGVHAVDGVSMRIEPGRVYGIIGPNGSGKTTLVGLLTGLHVPTRGDLRVDGVAVTGKRLAEIARMRIARTFQNLQLFSRLSALANVVTGFHSNWPIGLFGELLAGRSSRHAETAASAGARRILADLGVAQAADRPVTDLPLAQQRLVEIARALAMEPSILFLDEPAAGLNPAEIVELVRVLRIVSGRGVTLVIVEHHMDLIMSLCDHIWVLETGHLIAEGTPSHIQSDRRVIEAYLGTSLQPV